VSDTRRDNVERARRAYEAFARGNLEAALADMDEDIEWHQAQGLPHGGVYRGLAAVRKAVFEPLEGEWWQDFAATPSELIACGQHVIVVGRYTGRGRRTGAVLDVPFAHIWTFRRGRAVRFRQFTDTRGWVEALGGPD